MKYDFLIVGSGLFGSTLANILNKYGFKIFVIDKREHIGGNVYTEKNLGIDVHKYGPHIFHTNSKKIWDFVNQFAEFNGFINRVKANYKGKIYSLPINLMTLYQVAGCVTPNQAEDYLYRKRIKHEEIRNLEEWITSKVGYEIYEILFKGYTRKQWMRDPRELPASIISRLPIRLNFDDNYYDCTYQGIPKKGYTDMISNMLQDIKVELAVDFFSIKDSWQKYADRLIYSGPIDKFFEYQFGKLEYRSLEFKEEIHKGDYQGNAQINYTDYEIPYTRIIEHKHFTFSNSIDTIITKEYPVMHKHDTEPYYPINTEINNKKYELYRGLLAESKDIIMGGRLGSYKYYDMDQVIGQALHVSDSLLR